MSAHRYREFPPPLIKIRIMPGLLHQPVYGVKIALTDRKSSGKSSASSPMGDSALPLIGPPCEIPDNRRIIMARKTWVIVAEVIRFLGQTPRYNSFQMAEQVALRQLKIVMYYQQAVQLTSAHRRPSVTA